MDQPAESITPTEPIEPEHLARDLLVGWCGWRERRPLPERAVGPVLVVVQRVGGHDALELSAADDQQSVEAFTTHAPGPSARRALAPVVPAPVP